MNPNHTSEIKHSQVQINAGAHDGYKQPAPPSDYREGVKRLFPPQLLVVYIVFCLVHTNAQNIRWTNSALF